MKVGYLGPEGSYGYMAARKFFADLPDESFIPINPQGKICSAVGKLQVDFGVVAIENVIDGMIAETIHGLCDADTRFGVKITGEVSVPIEHFLLRQPGAEGQFTTILSHESAIRQCQRLVAEMAARGVSVERRGSTAQAAEEAAGNPQVAAIASAYAQERFGLERVRPDSVGDRPGNETRFWILGKQHAARTGRDKTTLLFNLEHDKPGGLYRTLGHFANSEPPINLLVIFANPMPGRRWEYTFLAELSGHIDDPQMDRAMEALESSGEPIARFLGSYPDAISTTLAPEAVLSGVA